MYGAAQLSCSIAIDRELPAVPEHEAWSRPVAGLLLTAALTLLTAHGFDLSSVATPGSSGLLLIFPAVNTANARPAKATRSHAWLSTCGALA